MHSDLLLCRWVGETENLCYSRLPASQLLTAAAALVTMFIASDDKTLTEDVTDSTSIREGSKKAETAIFKKSSLSVKPARLLNTKRA